MAGRPKGRTETRRIIAADQKERAVQEAAARRTCGDPDCHDENHWREVPFPVVETHSHTVLLQFTEPADRDLFRKWLVHGGGWQAFGDFVDGQP